VAQHVVRHSTPPLIVVSGQIVKTVMIDHCHSTTKALTAMPSTLPSLQARLDALQETHKATLLLINRLISLKLEPGSLPSNQSAPDARAELTAEIHHRLKSEDEGLEIASQEVQDAAGPDLSSSTHRDSERVRTQALLAIQVAKLREDFNQYVSYPKREII
jgi:hypothetical protein